jgi:anti-sigma B factor antagonist
MQRMSLSDAEIDSENFRIDVLRDAGGLIIALAGEFDLSGIRRFENAYADVAATGPESVVIDFTELQFIDSSGVSSVVKAMADQEHSGSRLRACGARGQVQQILELVGALERLELVPRPEAAVTRPRAEPH